MGTVFFNSQYRMASTLSNRFRHLLERSIESQAKWQLADIGGSCYW